MRTRLPSCFALLGIALAGIWTGACGSTSDSISLPSALNQGSHSAVIRGTVTSDASGFGAEASASAAQGAGLRVSVVGLTQSTHTDTHGRFTLMGLPGGQVTLRFEGPGVDARLGIGGLLDGRTLTIRVEVAGNRAQVISVSSDGSPSPSPTPSPNDADDEAEFVGTVESVSPPSLVVSGVSVLTDARTEIKRGHARIAVAKIQLGETAKVEGAQQPDGSVLAREIKLSGQGVNGDEIELEGVIDSISAPSLVVSGRTVVTDANTKFKGKGHIESLADLSVGDAVEVEGVANSDGSIQAHEIKREEKAADDDQDDDEEDEEEDGDDDGDDDDDADDNSGSGS